MLAFVSNYKVVHIALVVAALVVVILRNHGVISAADVDAAVASLGALGVGLNVNLSTNDRTAVVQSATETAAIVETPAPAIAVETPAASA